MYLGPRLTWTLTPPLLSSVILEEIILSANHTSPSVKQDTVFFIETAWH